MGLPFKRVSLFSSEAGSASRVRGATTRGMILAVLPPANSPLGVAKPPTLGGDQVCELVCTPSQSHYGAKKNLPDATGKESQISLLRSEPWDNGDIVMKAGMKTAILTLGWT